MILLHPNPDKQGLNLYFIYLPPCSRGSMDRTRALLPGEPHQASFRRSWQAQMARFSASLECRGWNHIAAFCRIFLLRALYVFEKSELIPKTVKEKHVINTFQSVSSCQQQVRVLIIISCNTVTVRVFKSCFLAAEISCQPWLAARWQDPASDQ